MIVCPKPMVWDRIYKRLKRMSESRLCVPAAPPMPLILTGWHASDDLDKMKRWEETRRWAIANELGMVVRSLEKSDWYFTEWPIISEPHRYFSSRDGNPRPKASKEDREALIQKLCYNWESIAGRIHRSTIPVALTGTKGRRLVVKVTGRGYPTWGGWTHLSNDADRRRSFTVFRAKLNQVVDPFGIDIVDFDVSEVPRIEGARRDRPQG